MRIAIADDHAVVRMGYRRLLELEPGLEVVAEYADADAAYDDLMRGARGRVDLLILDLSMPGRSGLDLLRRLSLQLPALRVLVFSMHDNPAMVAQCLRAGAAGFVPKSGAPEELVDAVRRVAAGEPVGAAAAAGAADPLPPHMGLSAREFEVLHHLLSGASVETIARSMHLSEKTVANHQTQIKRKLGAANGVELVRYGRQHNLC